MKQVIITSLFLLVCTGCKNSTPNNLDKYTMDYSIQKNQYGVVVAEDDGISAREAKKQAILRAAEIAHQHGYRYFVITRENRVIILKGEEDPDMPGNIYYPLIQSGNFDRSRLQTPDLSVEEQVQGYQIEFSCQETAPSAGKFYDVCDYGLCP